MKKPCNVFGIMCDIVFEWIKRHNINISSKQLNDLRTRLSNADNTLMHKYSCTKSNKIELEEV
jgi:hypothetical protein